MAIEPGSRVHPKTRCRPVTISEVAASIELSDSHFRRAFKIATGLLHTMVAERAHRRSAEALERGRYVVIGDRHCDGRR